MSDLPDAMAAETPPAAAHPTSKKAKAKDAKAHDVKRLRKRAALDGWAILRVGLWSLAAIGAVTGAIYANQLAVNAQLDRVAEGLRDRDVTQLRGELAGMQTQLRDQLADSRKAWASVASLGADRDRLAQRMQDLEHMTDSVTGALGRDIAAATAALEAKPVQPTPLRQIAVVPERFQQTPIEVPKQRFAIDLGGAPSLDGLRAIWRRETAASGTIAALQPKVLLREKSGGAELRLLAGPFDDAEAAVRACANSGKTEPGCETRAFEGATLTIPPLPPIATPAVAAPKAAARPRLRARPRAVAPRPAATPKPSGLSSLLGG